MTIRRTAHSVYDTKYHLVWTPKCRKWIKREDIRDKAKEIFLEVSEHYGFEIQEIRVAEQFIVNMKCNRQGNSCTITLTPLG